MSGNNLKRVFSDVVSIDGWHTPFDGVSGVASVHIDAVFGDARIGGELDAPIRFRLRLKKAEIVVVIPSSEPLEVQKATVARSQSINSVSIRRRSETTANSHISIGAAILTVD